MIEWLIKKVILRKFNSMIDSNKESVEKIRSTLLVWISRIEKITGCLKSLLAKLEDNKIDSDEVKATASEINQLVKEWK